MFEKQTANITLCLYCTIHVPVYLIGISVNCFGMIGSSKAFTSKNGKSGIRYK